MVVGSCRVSMGLEKIFQIGSWAFLFVAEPLFLFLNGVSGADYFHFVVRFCMVCGAFQHGLWCASVG